MANADSATNMLWLINQATAGEISGQALPPKTQPSGAGEKSGEKSGGEQKQGVLSSGTSGSGASFNDFKIDMNA